MNKKTGPKSRGREKDIRASVTGGLLMMSVRQRRHRAALFEMAAAWLTNTGGRGAVSITHEDGSVDQADLGVIADVAARLRGLADQERAAVREVESKNLGDITEKDCPVVEGVPPELDPLSLEYWNRPGMPPIPGIEPRQGSGRSNSTVGQLVNEEPA